MICITCLLFFGSTCTAQTQSRLRSSRAVHWLEKDQTSEWLEPVWTLLPEDTAGKHGHSSKGSRIHGMSDTLRRMFQLFTDVWLAIVMSPVCPPSETTHSTKTSCWRTKFPSLRCRSDSPLSVRLFLFCFLLLPSLCLGSRISTSNKHREGYSVSFGDSRTGHGQWEHMEMRWAAGVKRKQFQCKYVPGPLWNQIWFGDLIIPPKCFNKKDQYPSQCIPHLPETKKSHETHPRSTKC